MQKTNELATQTMQENNNENTQLMQQTPIEGTPFMLVTAEGRKFLAIGRYAVTPELGEEDVLTYLEGNKWDIVATIAALS